MSAWRRPWAGTAARSGDADPVTHFNLPDLPGVGRPITLDQAAGPTVDRLREFPFRRLRPEAGRPWHARASGPFAWADILVGDIGTIRRYAPADLSRKTVVVEHATEQDLADLGERGVAIAVTLMPALKSAAAGPVVGGDSRGRTGGVTLGSRSSTDRGHLLDVLADIQWAPHVRYLDPEKAEVNRFAFVIHPLNRVHPQAVL